MSIFLTRREVYADIIFKERRKSSSVSRVPATSKTVINFGYRFFMSKIFEGRMFVQIAIGTNSCYKEKA